MEFKTNYPFIFVHGMYGFGKGDILNDYLIPYWGMLAGDLTVYLRGEGFETHNPNVGGVASAWDRCCDLYAQIMGTKVDYGKVHSEKYGHERYGRTYQKPLIPKWDEKNKINLFGHSFGGTTLILFDELMRNGAKEEMDATPTEELSDFFKGGHGDWVYSYTTVTGTNNGGTIMYALKNFMDMLCEKSMQLASFENTIMLDRLWDFHMDHFGLTSKENGEFGKVKFNNAKAMNAAHNKDNVFYDLTLQGAKEINDRVTEGNTSYFFAFPCRKSTQKFFTPKRKEVPKLGMCPAFWPFSRAIGKYTTNTVDDNYIDEKWAPNDGLVNVISAKAPFGKKEKDFFDAKGNIEKGIWYVMEELPYDHLQAVGGFLPPAAPVPLRKIYRDHCRMINQL